MDSPKQTELFIFLAFFFFLALLASHQEQEAAGKVTPDLPPIITLAESDTWFRFPSGSAVITPEFEDSLRNSVVPRLNKNIDSCKCQIIEVIGHTDGQRVVPQKRRLSIDELFYDTSASVALDSLIPDDNPTLGLMRALAVRDVLKDEQLRGHLPIAVHILPLSAGQMIMPDETFADRSVSHNDSRRRRIEIRVRRAKSD